MALKRVKRARMATRLGVAVLGVGLAGCSAPQHHASRATSTTAPAATATTSASATSEPPSTTTSPASVRSSVATTAPQAARNLQATDQLRAQLLAAFAQGKGYPQSDFSGPVAGSLYYAYLPSTDTYWALATFSLVPGSPFQLSVDMQDGANEGIFSMPSGGSWQVRFGGIPFPCRGNFPDVLASVWALSYSPAC